MPDRNNLTAARFDIRMVCFDLGGVVIRICRSWPEGCAAAGLDVRDPEHRDATAAARREVIVEYQTGRIDGSTFAQRVSDILDGAYTAKEILAVHHAWMLGAYDGIDTVIHDLHGSSIRTAVLSNTNHEHWIRMDQYPTVGLVQHPYASHLIGLHKPDPKIYAHFEEQTDMPGRHILFFDDLEENVLAARNAGWHAEQIDPHGDTAKQVRKHLAVYSVMSGGIEAST